MTSKEEMALNRRTMIAGVLGTILAAVLISVLVAKRRK